MMGYVMNRHRRPVDVGERYCKQCAQAKPAKGGKEVKSPDGLRFRWKCADCCGGAAD